MVVTSELGVDRLKARIDAKDAQFLFEKIDTLECGDIFVEDFYAYLKRKGVPLSKNEVKFINKYFGFSAQEKLDLPMFQKKFIQFLNPTNSGQ